MTKSEMPTSGSSSGEPRSAEPRRAEPRIAEPSAVGSPHLEAQYNLAQHPARAPTYARYAAASEGIRDTLTWREVSYGEHARERFEWYPAGQGAPVLVFIHGGYWRALDKELFSCIARPFVASGIAVANVEYPLAPEYTLTQITASALSALSAVVREGERDGANVARLLVSGHSAGGHLAAIALAANWKDHGLPGWRPLAGMPISGLFELEPLRYVELNNTLSMTPEESRALSPALQPVHFVPATVVAVGAGETHGFRQQSERYATQLRRGGRTTRYLEIPDANHFTVLDALAEPSGVLFAEATRLLQA